MAQILNEKGFHVTGSDIEHTPVIDQMKKKGIKVYIGHDESYITKDISKIIYSSAVPKNNVEYKRAVELKIPIISFSEAIKELAEKKYIIAVCGTHGKTTVTAFASLAMIAGEKDPTVLVGSKLKEFGDNNYRVGEGDHFIVEACEYKRNFLNYDPDIAILTNIEVEHTDYFKDLEDYKEAFRKFLSKVPQNGFIIANADDKNVIDVVSGLNCNVILFSVRDKSCDWFLNEEEIWKMGEKVGELKLKIPGEFNKLNALCGLILGQIFNVDRNLILQKFQDFNGAWRRFEEIGSFGKIKIISDYAHHPTEIEKTISAAKEKYPDLNICCIFQPHQYSRTKEFLDEFAKSFKEADIVIIPNIYKVRDKKADIKRISADILVEAIENQKQKAYKIEDYGEIKKFLTDNKKDIGIVLIMGAGDIWRLGEFLLKN